MIKMGHTTVIFGNSQDVDCETLRCAFDKLPNTDIVEITPYSNMSQDLIDIAIANEEDTILFIGHGTRDGLLNPSWNSPYILHENNVHLVRAKNVICIFCHASQFCESVQLRSFSTSMFISNVAEAHCYDVECKDQDEINKMSMTFHLQVRELLRRHIPIEKWMDVLSPHVLSECAVDVFNRDGLHFCNGKE